MRWRDLLNFAIHAAFGNRLRTGLLILAMSIGVAAVVMLTALGDGARRYVVDEFSALGTNFLILLPGRTQTGGFSPGNAITSTVRDLTLDDAQAVLRARGVTRVTPMLIGTSEMSYGGKLREVMVAGTSSQYAEIRRLKVAQGRFLSPGDWRRSAGEVVLGAQVREDLFGNETAVGQLIRIGDRRFRVTGVMARSGQGLGQNTDELVLVPIATAQAMFNTNTLFRVMVESSSREAIQGLKQEITDIVAERHGGEHDITIVTQDSVLATFDKLLGALTLAVAGIAAISLLVAGILVMNVMLVSVTQRTSEIGLLKALGANRQLIERAFLTEAALLSAFGAVLGFLLGQAGAWSIRLLFPFFPAWPPVWAVFAALGIALASGLLFGFLPARRAARLDPVLALAKR